MIQKLICLAGQAQTISLGVADDVAMEITELPEDLILLRPPMREARGWTVEVHAGSRRLGYRPMTVRVTQEDGHVDEVSIPTRIFADTEAFLCMTTTCNVHWGFQPGRVAEIEARGGSWPEAMGDPTIFHGHAYASSCLMADGAHRYDLPVTWLIDGDVAEAGAADIAQWHQQYGDDVGLLPSSYFFNNAVNYNLERPLEDAVAVLEGTRAAVVTAMSAQGWRMQPTIAGIDQWVGGLGSRWIAAGARIGLRAFWGICFDHETCDTSMYHEGAPWECYRMQPENFRYPTTSATALWGFPWTARDLVNSFLEYPGASVFYSTDPDDISGCGILDAQADYWDRLLTTHLANRDTCDGICIVIHNEDHDAHRLASEAYLEKFYARLPEDIVPATLEEVRQWLDLRFPDGTHIRQLLELDDPLTCHAMVAAKRAPWQPPTHWQTVDGHNPSVLCAYDATARWMAVEGMRYPAQYIDYTQSMLGQETEVSPKAKLPVLTDWHECVVDDLGRLLLQVTFMSDCAFHRLPLLWWDRPEIVGDDQTRRVRIAYVDVVPGANTLQIALHTAPRNGVQYR